MIDLKEDFINWLIKQGLSEKTETGIMRMHATLDELNDFRKKN